jgi:hypothetical protein
MDFQLEGGVQSVCGAGTVPVDVGVVEGSPVAVEEDSAVRVLVEVALASGVAEANC